MSDTAERVRCRCGLPMQVTARGAEYCENCDSIQPQQAMGLPRKPTREDIRFKSYWLIEEAKYEDNTVQEDEGGTTDG